jgi:DnaJ homolog subfamily C member 10
VLKDEELRRKYDQFGEKGLEEGAGAGGEQYQSWQFYRDNFGWSGEFEFDWKFEDKMD